jgi:hypothetical protein
MKKRIGDQMKIKNGKFLISIILSLFLSCKENTPVENEEPIDNTLITETIDASGGVLSTENYILKVPQGAFSNSYQLNLSESDNKNMVDDEVVSRLYKISGLPIQFNDSLRIAIKYEKNLEKGTYIIFSSYAIDPDNNKIFINLQYEEAYDSSGFLVSFLKSPFQTNKNILKHDVSYNNDMLAEIYQEAIHKNVVAQSNHFVYTYPLRLKFDMENFIQIMEHNYDMLLAYNIGIIDELSRQKWLIIHLDNHGYYSVPLVPFDARQARPAEGSSVYIDRYIMFVNENALINKMDALSQLGGRSLTELSLKSTYDLKLNSQIILANFGYLVSEKPENYYLIESIASWSEELFTGSNFVKPNEFDKYVFAPFSGLRKGAGKDDHLIAYRHGIGISSVIKYLTTYKLYDQSLLTINDISDIYVKINDNLESDPTLTLIETVHGSKSEWWPDFFIKYVGGKIYQASGSQFIKPENLSGTWNIQSHNDILQPFNNIDTYPDLSAKLFLVNQDYADIDPSANLDIDVSGKDTDDGLTSIAFVYKNSALEYINHADAVNKTHKIHGLKNYFDQGLYQFIIAVVNSNGYSYDGTSEIDLTLSVEETPPEPDLYSCYVNVRVQGKRNEVSDTTNRTYEYTIIMYSAGYEGSFTGNTFTASYVEFPINRTITGSIEAVLDDNRTKVISIDWVVNDIHNTQGWRVTKALSAQNIPLDNDDSGLEFFISGETVTDHIVTIRDEQYSPGGGLSYVIQEYWSTADSYIGVRFFEP